ncbi:MAG: M67 family metallopeptidase [Candidatus Nitrosotenuis sp.]
MQRSITITNSQRQLLIEHAIKYAPNESCALLFGKVNQECYMVQEVFLTNNIDNSPINFTISNEELLRGYMLAEQKGLEVIGIFHSHPHSEAVPSATDKKFMEANPVVWIIFSNSTNSLAAYILESKVEPVPIRII